MKIFVRAQPKAKKNSVEKIGETTYRVSVKEPPTNGRANAAVLKALAAHFSVPRSRLRLMSGTTSRSKVVKVE